MRNKLFVVCCLLFVVCGLTVFASDIDTYIFAGYDVGGDITFLDDGTREIHDGMGFNIYTASIWNNSELGIYGNLNFKFTTDVDTIKDDKTILEMTNKNWNSSFDISGAVGLVNRTYTKEWGKTFGIPFEDTCEDIWGLGVHFDYFKLNTDATKRSDFSLGIAYDYKVIGHVTKNIYIMTGFSGAFDFFTVSKNTTAGVAKNTVSWNPNLDSSFSIGLGGKF